MTALWVVLSLGWYDPVPSVSASRPFSAPDCGVNCLFLLLRVEGHATTLPRLVDSLPSAVSEGYSMAELQAAARRQGMKLRGVRLETGRGLDRPAIVLLLGAKTGHYVLMRPVGTTARLVQILDPPRAPQVVAFDQVVAGPYWTGKALIPVSLRERLLSWMPLVLAGLIAAIALRSRWSGPGPRRVAERPSVVQP